MEATLMEVFGPWLPLVFGLGATLLVGGLVVKQAASGRTLKEVGRGAANAAWRMMLLLVAFYLLVRVLAALFESTIPTLPGA